MDTPQCDPTKLTLVCEMAPILTWSWARDKNAANVLTKGTVRPLVPHPMATPTKFCSAMKHSMNLSGCSFCKIYVKQFENEKCVLHVSMKMITIHVPCKVHTEISFQQYIKKKFVMKPANIHTLNLSECVEVLVSASNKITLGLFVPSFASAVP